MWLECATSADPVQKVIGALVGVFDSTRETREGRESACLARCVKTPTSAPTTLAEQATMDELMLIQVEGTRTMTIREHEKVDISHQLE